MKRIILTAAAVVGLCACRPLPLPAYVPQPGPVNDVPVSGGSNSRPDVQPTPTTVEVRPETTVETRTDSQERPTPADPERRD